MNKKLLTTKEFIERSKKTHGEKYDYSFSSYKQSKVKVKILCKIHGFFEQNPVSHYKGKGCVKCGIESGRNKQKKTTVEFIAESKKVHRLKYDYSKSIYKNSHTKIIIICKKHGEFKQIPKSHLKGSGCNICGQERGSKKQIISHDKWVQKCTKTHNGKYDYTKSKYIKSTIYVEIICPIHGSFFQSPSFHSRGVGCNECSKDVFRVDKKIKSAKAKIKHLIYSSYKTAGYTKINKSEEILGCTKLEFINYLNNNKYGFNVGDEGLDLDHIVSLSNAKNEKDVFRLNHYTNFQLLPSEYNRFIKHDRPWDKKHFEKWLISNN